MTRTLLAAVLAASLALPAVAQASGYYASPPHYPDAAAAAVTICRLRGELYRRDRKYERAAAGADNDRNGHAYDAGRAGR